MHRLLISLLASAALAPVALAQAQAPAAPAPSAEERAATMAAMRAKQNATPDTAGTGRFAALKEEVASLPDHVIYRPAKLASLGKQKLGIYIFGNGACSNDGASSRLHLLEIASHGYLAIAPGRVRNGPGAIVETATNNPPPAPTSDGKLPKPPTSAADLRAALDWALAQNADAASPLFGKLDPAAVAISGYSCGGLQALQIADDPRVKTVIIMNSGIFRDSKGGISGIDIPKSALNQLHTPTLYVLGGETDIAYPNGMDDFDRIRHVPVYVGNLVGVGHGGSYWQPNGGKAAAAVVAWLDWQLRGDAQAQRMFVGKDCGLCKDKAWKLESHAAP